LTVFHAAPASDFAPLFLKRKVFFQSELTKRPFVFLTVLCFFTPVPLGSGFVFFVFLFGLAFLRTVVFSMNDGDKPV